MLLQAGTRPEASLESDAGVHAMSGDKAKGKAGGNANAMGWYGVKGDVRGGG